MKKSTQKVSWQGRVLAVVLSLALSLGALEGLPLLAAADQESDTSMTMEVSDREVAGWLKDAGKEGLKLSEKLLKEVAGDKAGALQTALEEQIADAGILIRQVRPKNQGIMLVVAQPDDENVLEHLTLIGVNGSEDPFDFTMKVTGEEFHVYQAAMASYDLVIPPSNDFLPLEGELGDLLQDGQEEESVSSELQEETPSSVPEEGTASDSVSGPTTSDTVENSSAGMVQESVSSATEETTSTTESVSSTTEGGANQEDNAAPPTEDPSGAPESTTEAGGAPTPEPSPIPEDAPAPSPTPASPEAATEGGASAGALSNRGTGLAAKAVSAILRAFDEELPPVYALENGPSGELTSDELDSLGGEGYKVELPGAGFVVLSMAVSPSPIFMADQFFAQTGKDAAASVSVSYVPAEGDKNGVATGKAFTYTVHYELKVSPEYHYGDSSQNALFDEYRNIRVAVQLPEGIVALPEENERDGLEIEGNLCTYRPGDTTNANGNFPLTVRMEGNGTVPNGTAYTIPSAKIMADVTVNDGVSGQSKEYKDLTYQAAEYPTVKSAAADNWVLKKTLIPFAENQSYKLEAGKDGEELVVLQYKLEVGLNNNGGEPTADHAPYDKYGRLNFTSDGYCLTDILPHSDSGSKQYAPVSAELYLLDADGKPVGNPLDTSGEGETELSTTQYNKNDREERYNYIEKGAHPAYTAYQVEVKYKRSDLRVDFDDPEFAETGVTLINGAKLDYTLVGEGEEHRTANVPISIKDVKNAGTLVIEKYIGKDASSAQPYTKTMAEEFTGGARFRITGPNGYHAEVTLDPSKDGMENGTLTILNLKAGTYTIEETGVPSYTKLPASETEKKQTVVIKEGETKTVSFYNPINGRAYITFRKEGTDGKTHAPLVGVTFTVDWDSSKAASPAPENFKSFTVTSGEGGSVFFAVEPGSYIIKEKVTLEGYIPDATEYKVTVGDGETKAPDGLTNGVLFNRKNSAELVVRKYLLGYTGNVKQDGTAETAREVIPSEDRSGFKFVIEKKSGSGEWVAVGDPITTLNEVTVDGNKYTQFTVSNLPVYEADGKTPVQYRVNETEKPSAYGYADSQFTEFALKPNQSNIVKIDNLRKGMLKLQKTQYTYDKDGNLQTTHPDNIAFELYKEVNGQMVKVTAPQETYTTDKDGMISVDGLDIVDGDGKFIEYYWAESNTAQDYKLANTDSTLKTPDGKPVLAAGHAVTGNPKTLAADNLSVKAALKVEKKDGDTGNLLAGAKFKLEKKDESGKFQAVTGVGEWDSVTSGATVLLLEPGTYRVTELTAPAGYGPYSNPKDGVSYQEVTIEPWTTNDVYKNAVKTLTFKNYKLQQIKLHKHVYEYKGYGNIADQNSNYTTAEFEVYREDGSSLTQVTDLDYTIGGQNSKNKSTVVIKQGQFCNITNLQPGTYYLKEIGVSSSKGVLTPDQIPDAYLTTSELASGSISEKNWLVRKDQGGQTGLFFGPVELSERQSSGKETVLVKARDFQNASALKIIKQSLASKGLAGATFSIVGTAGGQTVVERTATTGKDGSVIVDKLPIYTSDGKQKISYTVTETAAPEGYVLDAAPQVIDELKPMLHLVDNGSGLNTSGPRTDDVTAYKWGSANGENNTLTFKDAPLVSLKVRKVGRDSWNSTVNGAGQFSDIRLAGVELALYQWNADSKQAELVTKDGAPVTETTDVFGDATFKDLSHTGYYYVIETAAPAGYSLPEGKRALRNGTDALPSVISKEDLESYNCVEYDFSGKPGFTEAGALADLTETPLVNYVPWVQFRINKVDQDTKVGLDGARFELYGRSAEGLNSLADLDLTKGKIGKDYYESGAALGEKGIREPGIVHTEKLTYGDIYWITETAPPDGHKLSEKPTVVLLPEDLYEKWKDSLQEWMAEHGVGHVVKYSINSETEVVFENPKGEIGGSGGEGSHLYVKLKKVVYDSQKDMLSDKSANAEKGAALGGVTFELWLLGKDNEPLVKLDTLTTGLDYQVSKVKNQAISRRIDLSQYEKLANTSVVYHEDGKYYTARMRLVEVSAPAGVILETKDAHYDFEVSGEKVNGEEPTNTTYFDKPIRNYRIEGYTLTLQKYGYTRRDGLNFAAADDKANWTNEDDWLAEQLNDSDVLTPLSGVKFQLEHKTGGKWEMVTKGLETDQQGRVFFPGDDSTTGLEPGEYRLYETDLGKNAGKYENTHESTPYYFNVTNDNKTVTLYNPEQPTVRIVKNARTSFQENGAQGMSGLSFQVGDVTLTIGNDGTASSRIAAGQYTVSENKTPADSGYTEQYVRLTDQNGNVLSPSVKLNVGWNGQTWLDGNTVTVHARNAEKASLTIVKQSADNGQLLLPGAEFNVYRMNFRDTDFDKDGKLLDSLTHPDAESTGWQKVSGGTGTNGAFVTGQDGKIVIEKLVPGWYRIEEAKAPENYTKAVGSQSVELRGTLGVLASGAETVEATAKDTTVTVENTPYDKLTVEKIFQQPKNANAVYPENVVFNIYLRTAKEMTFVQSLLVKIQEENGVYKGTNEAKLARLSEGESYVLQESMVGLNGWIPDDTGENIVTINGGKYLTGTYTGPTKDATGHYQFTANNLYTNVHAVLNKVDAQDNSGLSGAEFQVYYLDGEQKIYLLENGANKIFTSDNTGKVTIDFALPEALRTAAAVKGGVDFYAVETAAPAGHVLSAEPVKLTFQNGDVTVENATVKNVRSATLELTKYNNLYANPNGAPQKDVAFSLYKVKGTDGELVQTAKTDGSGKLVFDHLEPGTQYALWEDVPEGYVKLDSIHPVKGTAVQSDTLASKELTCNEKGVSVKKALFLLPQQLTAGTTYTYNAYNLPKNTLTITKENADKNGEVPTARFAIYQANPDGSKGAEVVSSLATKAAGGEKYSSVSYALAPGSYVVEEIWSGLQLNKDDSRLETAKLVTLEAGGTETQVAFVNRADKVETALTKQAALTEEGAERLTPADSIVIGHSLLEKGTEITYTLSDLGGRNNNLPIDSYTVTDEGLTFYQEDGKTKVGNVSYQLTHLKIGAARYQDYMRSYKGDGTIVPVPQAVITLTNAEGGKDVITAELDPATGYECDLTGGVDGKPVVAFAVSYVDSALSKSEDAEHHYALGQNFEANNIVVTASVKKQEEGESQEAVRTIINKASVALVYRTPEKDGSYSAPKTAAARDDAEAKLPVPGDIPSVRVVKSSEVMKGRNGKNVNIGGELEYTLTLENLETSENAPSMMNPILIDRLPKGVELVSAAYGGESYDYELPAGVAYDALASGTAKIDGQTYLSLRFNGSLKPNQKIVVKYKVSVQTAVLLYSQTMTNTVQATSLEERPVYKGNPTGASIRAQGGTPAIKGDQKIADTFFNGKSYGYVGHAVDNSVANGNSLQVLKRVTANKEPGYYDGSDSAYVAESENARATVGGDIRYQMAVINTGTQEYTNLRVLDMLPNENGDYSLNGKSYARNSAWTPIYDKIAKVEKVNASGTTEKIAADKYTLTYSDQMIGLSGIEDASRMMLDDQAPNWKPYIDGTTDKASVKAVVLNFDESVKLAAGERLLITMEMKVPDYKQTENVYYKLAVNTFAVSFKDGMVPSRQKISSNFVKVILEPENVSVGGHVWIDKNDNGVQDDTALGTDGLPQVNVQLHIYHGKTPAGVRSLTTDAEGKFQFDDLSPSAGESKYAENDLYDKNGSLLTDRLRGDQTNYVLVITPPKGFGLAKSFAKNGGVQTRSTDPAKLQNDEDETKDSNFIQAGDSYVSERFYLWSSNLIDLTKDLGLVRTRTLQINKKDTGGMPVGGASFAVYGPFDTAPDKKELTPEKQLGVEITTNDQGEATVEDLLYYKYYAIVETKAADHFTLDGAVATGNLIAPLADAEKPTWILEAATAANFGEGGQTLTNKVTVTNRYAAGMLVLEKLDGSTEKLLSGAQFQLTAKSTEVEGAWAAYLKELTAQTDRVSGAKDVKASNGALVFTTDGSRAVQISGLPHGLYHLEETAAPDGYEKPDWNSDFAVTDSEGFAFTGENAVRNARAAGSLSIEKVDARATGKKLAGARFQLALKQAGEVEKEFWAEFGRKYAGENAAAAWDASGQTLAFTVDATGLTLTGLPYGEYTLTETAAPAGYQLGEPAWTQSFTISEENRAAAFAGAQAVQNQPVEYTLKKVDAETGTPLANVFFTVQSRDGGKDLLTLKTGEDGTAKFTFTELAANTEYLLTETATRQGYQLAEPIPFGMNENGRLTATAQTPENVSISEDGLAITVPNRLLSGSITVEKVVAGDNPKPDTLFKFQLYRSADEGATWTGEGAPVSLKAGETHTFEGLSVGTRYRVAELLEDDSEYRLADIRPVQGGTADLASRSYLFQPSAEVFEGKAQFTNERKLGTLDVLKYRYHSPEIYVDGAVFELYRYDAAAANHRGDRLTGGTTAQGGRLRFTGLAAGRYVLVESYAPNNYYVLRSQFEIELSIAPDGLTVALPAAEKLATLEDGAIRIPNSYGPPPSGGGTIYYGSNIFEDLVDILEDPTPLADLPDLPVPLNSLPKLPTTGGFPVASFGIIGLAMAALGLLLKRRSKKDASGKKQ